MIGRTDTNSTLSARTVRRYLPVAQPEARRLSSRSRSVGTATGRLRGKYCPRMDTSQPAAPPPVTEESLVSGKGLESNAIGFGSALSIGLDSTAPAYSLAAVIGIIVASVGLQAPAVLLVAFIPMFLTALAFAVLNRADPDCGTAFSWSTRALGPWMGWIVGWSITVTGVLVIGSLADVAASYTYLLFGIEGSALAVTVLAVVFIIAMTGLTIYGTEASGHVQNGMVVLQIGGLLLFAVVVLVKVLGGDGVESSVDPSLSWLNPLEIDSFAALSTGMLTAVFIYWGWESAVNLNEETTDSATTPGKAAVVSTAILLVTYILVAFAVLAWLGTSVGDLYNDDESVLADIAGDALGSPLDKIVVLAVLVSALASTQTTILPASRTSLSMASRKAFPRFFATIHPRFRTPWVGTALIAVLAILWYVPLKAVSENFLFDSITALGLMIAFYYSITGVASAVFYRKQLTDSVGNLFKMAILPVTGSAILAFVFVKAIITYANPDEAYSGSLFGIGIPLVIGGGFLLLGLLGSVLWYFFADGEYFEEPRQIAPAERPKPVLPSDIGRS